MPVFLPVAYEMSKYSTPTFIMKTFSNYDHQQNDCECLISTTVSQMKKTDLTIIAVKQSKAFKKSLQQHVEGP